MVELWIENRRICCAVKRPPLGELNETKLIQKRRLVQDGGPLIRERDYDGRGDHARAAHGIVGVENIIVYPPIRDSTGNHKWVARQGKRCMARGEDVIRRVDRALHELKSRPAVRVKNV